MTKNKTITVRTADELGNVLGLSLVESIEMEFRSEITVTLVHIIQKGQLTHAQDIFVKEQSVLHHNPLL